MLKKYLKYYLTFFIFLFSCTFCFCNNGSAIKNKRIIRATGDIDFPPYEYLNTKGEPTGFNVDIFKALMKELNFDYEISLVQWSYALDKLKSKESDVIIGMGITKSRLKEFEFVSPSSYLYFTVITRKDSPIYNLKDLLNKEVIVQEGAILSDTIRNNLNYSNVIRVLDLKDGLNLLSIGKHDAAICPDVIAKYLLEKNNIRNLEISDIVAIDPVKYCLATNKDSDSLRILLDYGMGRIKANGVYDKIYNKWLSPNEDSKFRKYFYISFFVILILATLAIIVTFYIRQYIRKVTTNLNRVNQEMQTSLLKIKVAIKASTLTQWDYDCSTKKITVYNDTTLEFSSNEPIEYYTSQVHPNDIKIINPIINRMNNKEDFSFSIDIRTRKNEFKDWGYMCIDGTAVKNNNNEVVKYTGFRKNNTRFVKLTEQLKEQSIYIGMALRTGNIIPAICDTKSRIFYTAIAKAPNNLDIKFSSSNGISFNELIDKISPEYKQKTEQIFFDIITGKTKKIYDEIIFINSIGEKDFYEINFIGINYSDDGIPEKIVGYFQNITKRKVAEEELKNQQEFITTLFDLIPIPIQIKDIEDGGKYILWNKATEDVFGIDTKNPNFSNIAKNFLDPTFYKETSEIDNKVFITEQPYKKQELFKTLDGREFETLVHKMAVRMNNKKYILIARWDITKEKEIYLKSKVLSTSMKYLKAYNWHLNPYTNIITYGEGINDIIDDPESINTIEKFGNHIHPKNRDNFYKTIYEFIEQDSGSLVLEYEIDYKGNGNYQWWEFRGSIETEIKEDGKKFKSIYGIDINIDSHKKVEAELLESRNKLSSLIKQNELILNNSNTGLVFLDKDYVVQWENLSSYNLFVPNLLKYKKGEICYKSVNRDNTYCCKDCIVQKSRSQKRVLTKEIVYKGKISELSAIPIFDSNDELIGTVIKTVDITEIKRINTELKTAKERAEEARIKAEESNKLKSAFLANMSHEIRAPLNAIVGFSNLIATAETLEEKDEYSRIINTNNDLLLTLINDILDLSKIEAGMMKFIPEEFNIRELFQNLYTTLSQRITNKNIDFICDTPNDEQIVYLDKNRITQIITNFATNAIKFTPNGSIKMGYEITNNILRIYVTDTGIGIEETKLPKVFERFEKLDDFAQGTGLGMAICKAIIDTLHGDIGVESKVGKGSTFWATINLIN